MTGIIEMLTGDCIKTGIRMNRNRLLCIASSDASPIVEFFRRSDDFSNDWISFLITDDVSHLMKCIDRLIERVNKGLAEELR